MPQKSAHFLSNLAAGRQYHSNANAMITRPSSEYSNKPFSDAARHRAKMLRRFVMLPWLLAILSLASCASASEITSVPPGTLVMDVRTPEEFREWHFPGAVNLPVQSLEENLDQVGDKDRAIIVYCRSGNRSGTAKKILLSNGFQNVKNGGGLRDMKQFAPKQKNK